MISFILAVIKLLIVLCIVATVHELGHFLAAKFFKVGVKEFSIGFGKKLFQKKYKETMYSLRCLPLGGYVMIEGEGEEHSDSETSFSKQNSFVKIIILVMGVVFNIILATVILMSIAFSYPTATTTIDKLQEDSILKEYGIDKGDTILKINNDKVCLANELIDNKYSDKNETVITYEENGTVKEITLKNAVKSVGQIGIAFKTEEGKSTRKVDTIFPGKAADKAGIKEQDEIISINDNKVSNSSEIIDIVTKNSNKKLIFKINRNNEIIEKEIIPEETKIFDLGIYSTELVDTDLSYAFKKTLNTISSVFKSYIDIFKGKVSLDDVSSIIGIGNVVNKAEDIIEYLNLLAIISLAIGVANILPFLPLDGGKIVIVLIEAITRKKVPEKLEIILTYLGFGLLMLITVFVVIKDIIRLI